MKEGGSRAGRRGGIDGGRCSSLIALELTESPLGGLFSNILAGKMVNCGDSE